MPTVAQNEKCDQIKQSNSKLAEVGQVVDIPSMYTLCLYAGSSYSVSYTYEAIPSATIKITKILNRFL